MDNSTAFLVQLGIERSRASDDVCYHDEMRARGVRLLVPLAIAISLCLAAIGFIPT